MKNEKILLVCIPILCVLAVIFAYLKIVNSNSNSDSIKFKEEYEAHNDIETPSGVYHTLNISENNPMKYSNYDELINIIEKGTGIIYLGFPECPWCRSMLPVLLNSAEKNKISTIYYLNILNERDSYVVEDHELVYELDENGNAKKGSEGYFKLLDALDDYLTEYTVSFEGKIYKTGEKRIYAPTVIFVKNGNVLGLHISTVSSQKSGFDKLTSDQEEELYGIFEDYILEMQETTCSSDSAC